MSVAMAAAADDSSARVGYITADDQAGRGATGLRFVGCHASVVTRVFSAHLTDRQSAGIRVFCYLNAQVWCDLLVILEPAEI